MTPVGGCASCDAPVLMQCTDYPLPLIYRETSGTGDGSSERSTSRIHYMNMCAQDAGRHGLEANGGVEPQDGRRLPKGDAGSPRPRGGVETDKYLAVSEVEE